jgi:pyridoxamine 5'-phosphate oxidase
MRDPARLFADWYERARAEDPSANVMALATAAGRPSVRMVELQALDERGFVFYSGYASRKGGELAENPWGALCFYWHPSRRQVRVEGAVARTALDPEEAEAAAHAAAVGKRQGEPIAGREELEGAPALPSDWGGYLLVPDAYEFWEYREDRLHDRLRYRLEAGGWTVERLFP